MTLAVFSFDIVDSSDKTPTFCPCRVGPPTKCQNSAPLSTASCNLQCPAHHLFTCSPLHLFIPRPTSAVRRLLSAFRLLPSAIYRPLRPSASSTLSVFVLFICVSSASSAASAVQSRSAVCLLPSAVCVSSASLRALGVNRVHPRSSAVSFPASVASAVQSVPLSVFDRLPPRRFNPVPPANLVHRYYAFIRSCLPGFLINCLLPSAFIPHSPLPIRFAVSLRFSIRLFPVFHRFLRFPKTATAAHFSPHHLLTSSPAHSFPPSEFRRSPSAAPRPPRLRGSITRIPHSADPAHQIRSPVLWLHSFPVFLINVPAGFVSPRLRGLKPCG